MGVVGFGVGSGRCIGGLTGHRGIGRRLLKALIVVRPQTNLKKIIIIIAILFFFLFKYTNGDEARRV